jgi:hypothetical protein
MPRVFTEKVTISLAVKTNGSAARPVTILYIQYCLEDASREGGVGVS